MSGVEIISRFPRQTAHTPKTGETIRAPNLASVWKAVNDLSSVAVRSGVPSATDDGRVMVQLLGITAFGPVPGDGTVICRSLDDVQGTPQPYTVLLPSTFYETARGTRTFVYTSAQQRTATDGGDNETQFLIPEILLGDVLMCIYSRGVWQDLNIDGRQWVADPPP